MDVIGTHMYSQYKQCRLQLTQVFLYDRPSSAGTGQQKNLLQPWNDPPSFNPYNEIQTVSIEFGEEKAPGAFGMHALTVTAP